MLAHLALSSDTLVLARNAGDWLAASQCIGQDIDLRHTSA
jgi:hypothetical protein